MADVFDQIHAQESTNAAPSGGRGGGGVAPSVGRGGGRGGGMSGQQSSDIFDQIHADANSGQSVQPKTGFGGRLLQNLNPVPMIDALVHHPIDTVKNIVTPGAQPSQEAADAFNQGNYGTAAERTAEAIPIVGPIIRQTRQDVTRTDAQGNWDPDIGAVAGTAGSLALPWALGKAKVNLRVPSSLNPVEESAVNYAAREGIPVDLGTATGNKAVGGMQALAEKQPLLSRKVGALRQAQQEGIQQAGTRLAQGIAPNGAADAVTAGEGVSDTLTRRIQKLNAVADQSYDKLRKLANNPANIRQVQIGEEPSGILDAQGNPVMKPIMREVRMPTDYTAIKAQVAPIVDQLEKAIPQAQADASPGLRAMRQILKQPDLVDVDTAIKDLSTIQGIARTAGELPEVRGMSKGIAASMVPKMRAAIDDAAAKAGVDASDALDRGRLATRSKYAVNDVLKALPRNAMGEIEPSQVFSRLTRSGDQSLELLRSVQAKAPGSLPSVARAYVEGLVNDMVYQGDVRRAQSAVRAWHNLGDETKGILFDPQTQQNITDYVNYAEMIGRKANPSGTASTAAILAALHPKLLIPQLFAGRPIANALFGDVGANPSIKLGLGPVPKAVGAVVGGNVITPEDQNLPHMAKGGIIGPPKLPTPGRNSEMAKSGEDIIRGSSNIPLSPMGEKQANELGTAFKRKGGVDEIHTSDLLRARQTADAISKHTGAPITKVTKSLHPWHLGEIEGTPTKGALDKINTYITKKPNVPVPGKGKFSSAPGESFNTFKRRTLSAFKGLIRLHQANPNKKILATTHYRDIRLGQSWVKHGAPPSMEIDAKHMMGKGDPPASVHRFYVNKHGQIKLDPVDMNSKEKLPGGVYLVRHGVTALNGENRDTTKLPALGTPA